MSHVLAKYVRRCPNCASLISLDRLANDSFGRGGGTLWTDGVTTGGRSWSSALLARCATCRCIFPEVEADDAPNDERAREERVPREEWPVEEWLTFLEMCLDDDPYEVHGRRGLWLTDNDIYRGLARREDPANSERDARVVQNMERLLELWRRQPPKALVLIMELLRQLRRYDEALAFGVTAKPQVNNYDQWHLWVHIVERCRRKDPWPRRVWSARSR